MYYADAQPRLHSWAANLYLTLPFTVSTWRLILTSDESVFKDKPNVQFLHLRADGPGLSWWMVSPTT